jgi:hypothetical protein
MEPAVKLGQNDLSRQHADAITLNDMTISPNFYLVKVPYLVLIEI